MKNGAHVIVITTWNEPDCKVTVDFSGLDSTFTEPIEAEHRSNGEYIAEHTISEGNEHADGSRVVVITAEDAAGNRTVWSRFRMKLRNELPLCLVFNDHLK